MPNPKPITIRGTAYPSRAAAAEALGITPSAVSKAANRKLLETCGLALETTGNRHNTASLPVKIRGTEYPSAKAAGDALGLHRASVSKMIGRGHADRIGTGRGKHGKQGGAIPLVIDGVTYNSLRAACRALNIPRGRGRTLLAQAKQAAKAQKGSTNG
jgi:hypothetical protein